MPQSATAIESNYWVVNNEAGNGTYWVRSADARGAWLTSAEWLRMVWADQPPITYDTGEYANWCSNAWNDMMQRIAHSTQSNQYMIISDASSVYDRIDHWRLFVESQGQDEESVPLLDPEDGPVRPRRRRRQGRGLCILRQERARCPNDCPCRTRTRPRRQRGAVDGNRPVEQPPAGMTDEAWRLHNDLVRQLDEINQMTERDHADFTEEMEAGD